MSACRHTVAVAVISSVQLNSCLVPVKQFSVAAQLGEYAVHREVLQFPYEERSGQSGRQADLTEDPGTETSSS